MIYIPQLSLFSYTFPDPRFASPEGIVAFGGDLSPNRVLQAYKRGIFPWYNEGDPILWWSPDPRLVLYPEDIKISRSLKKSLKKFEVRFDQNFEAVIRNCKDIRSETWILPEIIEVFCELHEMGFAHSVETYQNGELVGGLYGLSLGGAFFGESMFALVSDASKVALVHLTQFAQENGLDFIDCQIPSAHLKRLGAVEISRDQFLQELESALQKPGVFGKWNFKPKNTTL
ncbi:MULTISPECIES: leucyl/phenylalanyl-tRNA--protein transferase [unclassified Nitratiruptor]|uniref:leucyl/phenylalanyl-tRNA--protein transferase n=1 Tax=unclassified Nitratiruptor TaxID=2624044 RepID=UPI001915023F|nr:MULTISPECIES: leucyl/phenylalanyl-tRNA--protein transferase [unclassified Nitratiruptor]BCD59718.1 leucyl/phenylalanyl-tRNA---protein transferase [Nitratiruptor sp. YY08-10]BCD63642.1 leucyl/phenylalanyl-tRNA---protein transferase [Nitratiruptor sp. YY08-14]